MGYHDAWSDDDYRQEREREMYTLKNSLKIWIDQCDDVYNLHMLRKITHNIEDVYAVYRLLNAMIR